jgi:hypothetical protein
MAMLASPRRVDRDTDLAHHTAQPMEPDAAGKSSWRGSLTDARGSPQGYPRRAATRMFLAAMLAKPGFKTPDVEMLERLSRVRAS